MDTDLEELEAKIEQVVALVHQLRAENEVLKNQIAEAEAERLHLRRSMTAARERLESLVDNKMREIAQRTRSTIAERVAVMAALNIAHEHLSAPGAAMQKEVDFAVDTSHAKRRIAHMGARIGTVLAPQQQLDI